MLTTLKKKLKTGSVLQAVGLTVIILLIGITMQVMNGNFLSAANMEVMVMNLIFEGIMAIGMTFVIIGGGIDLSVSAVFPFAEIIVAKLMIEAGLPIFPAVLITLVLCLGIGLLNATLINAMLNTKSEEPKHEHQLYDAGSPRRLEALEEELRKANTASRAASIGGAGSSGGGAPAALKPHELHERILDRHQKKDRWP